jgi:hypothetical protein
MLESYTDKGGFVETFKGINNTLAGEDKFSPKKLTGKKGR